MQSIAISNFAITFKRDTNKGAIIRLGKSVEATLQDIYAKVLTKNITAVAIAEADEMKEDKCKNRKLKYKINFTQALCEIKDNIIRYIMETAPYNLGSRIIKKISHGLRFRID